jgi:alginate O-acetyltransferase complex protein AlgI
MIFSSYWFVCALPIFLVCYAISKSKLRTILLVLFCLIFHAHFAGAAGVLPIVFLGVLTYLLALIRNRSAQIVGIVICLAALIFYKYSHFICLEVVGLLNRTIASFLDESVITILPAAAPLAISFFVFEFVHYLRDVRQGTEVIKKPVQFVQFALFFPTLVAGPIKRYESFLPALQEGKDHATAQDFSQGIVQVAVGFFKKSVLADNLALYIASTAPRFTSISQPERWFFLLATSFRIYFDFSGYSDIAIGIARIMGIEVPINFNWPYIARNLREFWHRWHISLSSWIRDYVYIPLGGSRQGKFRTISNGMIAFALVGLWHGAAWNFLSWGLYHGLGLAVSTNYRKFSGKLGTTLGAIFDKMPAMAWATTFCYVSLGWLLFFYPISQALRMLQLLFLPASSL